MAILKRRTPRDMFGKIREAVWPSMGWRRTFSYYRHRIFRTGDSTYKITAGLASGVAISFTPFLGTHFAQALFLSWLLRASLIGGFVGTALGNPWTFPFIFILIYKTGMIICGFFGLHEFLALPAAVRLGHEESAFDFLRYLFSHPVKLLLPATVGGYAWAVLSWFLSYGLLYYPVRAMRHAYREAREWRRQVRRNRKESQP